MTYYIVPSGFKTLAQAAPDASGRQRIAEMAAGGEVTLWLQEEFGGALDPVDSARWAGRDVTWILGEQETVRLTRWPQGTTSGRLLIADQDAARVVPARSALIATATPTAERSRTGISGK